MDSTKRKVGNLDDQIDNSKERQMALGGAAGWWGDGLMFISCLKLSLSQRRNKLGQSVKGLSGRGTEQGIGYGTVMYRY